jgi:hypothetical protein
MADNDGHIKPVSFGMVEMGFMKRPLNLPVMQSSHLEHLTQALRGGHTSGY